VTATSAARKLLPSTLLLAAKRELAKRSLYEFVKQSWTVHESEPPQWNWHIEAFCWHVQMMLEGWLVANGHGTDEMRARQIEMWRRHGLRMIEGELLVQNLIANLPPQTLKSRILMVCAPAWMWIHFPAWKVCCISGVDDNVKRDSNAHRDLVESPWYISTFLTDDNGKIAWTVRGDIDAVGEWVTTAGGERKSKTMLGSYQGIHSDGIFLDDPDDAHRVHSEPARRDVQGKWTRAIKNRVKNSDKSIRIAVQQRVHVDDWTSAQLAKGLWGRYDRKAWAWFCLPLMFGRAPKEVPATTPWGWTDPRTVANENLHPVRFSEAMIADEIRDRGPEGFEAQYNENPAPLDGGLIKRTDVRFFRIAGEPIADRKRPIGCGLDADGNNIPAIELGYRDDGTLDLDWLTITIDCSNGSEAVTASAVGILVCGGRGMQRFVLDDRTDIMGIQGMYDAVADAIRSWPAEKILIELAAAGTSVINELGKLLAAGKILWPDGTPAIVEIVAITPGTATNAAGIVVQKGRDSKQGRAAAMAPAWRAGLWFVLEGADWLYAKVIAGGRVTDPGFIGEVCTFPKSARNDRIDALSQLATYYREEVKSWPDYRNLRTA
jgi:hypothetical protein